MRRLRILAVTLGFNAGCADPMPTAVAGIHDAVERVIPSLPDEQSRAELRAVLSTLADALARPDATTPVVFRPARHVIDGLATGGDGARNSTRSGSRWISRSMRSIPRRARRRGGHWRLGER